MHTHDPLLDGICNPQSGWIIQPGITAECATLSALLAAARESQKQHAN